MRRLAIATLTAGLMFVSAAGCDGLGDISGISFRLGGPDDFPHLLEGDAIPFTADGWHVNRENLCGEGTATIDRLESIDGETLTDANWDALLDAARENNGVAGVVLFQDFECEDGSGGFSMRVQVEYDFDFFEFTGEQDIGTWEIEEGEGTGSYTDLAGRGDVALDWDEDGAWYGGEVFP